MQLIARAAGVLRALGNAPEGLGLSELARRAGLPKTTVHRLIGALAAEQFVTTGSDGGRVRLGPGLAALAVAAAGDIRDRLRPHLEALHKEVDETIDLAVLDGDEVRFIDQIQAPHRLRAVSAVGARFPLHCTANGKALLAALAPEQANRLLPHRLHAYTEHTITSRPKLRRELEKARASGVAYDREEHTAGISAVGTTVRDALGQLAAITIVVPTQRFSRNEKQLADRLLDTRRAAQSDLVTDA